MYRILRTLLFFFPAESVHYFSMNALRWVCRWKWGRSLVAWSCHPDLSTRSGLHRQLFGLIFRNPVGLGAGFDKNARYLRELDALGFGYVEIGTVTPLPQAGNEQPRLFRLPEDQALINRMGFNNDGVKVIAERLKQWRMATSPAAAQNSSTHKSPTTNYKPETKSQKPETGAPLLIGGNIGKNKVTPNEDAWKDYEICFRELFNDVDYFVVNVSSPNTPGLRELQEKDALRRILTNLQSVNTQLARERSITPRPLLLKIAPDLTHSQLDDVIGLALEIRLDGLVAANTTISRERLLSTPARLERIGAGGLSGAPLKERATDIVQYIHRKTGGAIPIIASGGIFTGDDAIEKINAGATLVQIWTGFIYEGPFIVSRICRALVAGQ